MNLTTYLNILSEAVVYSNDIKYVYEIISTFSADEKQKFMGPRDFYDSSDFRKIKIDNKIPVAYLEAKIFNNRAKINIGTNSKYRNKNHMKDLFNKSVIDLSKLGVTKIIAGVSKQNDKSNNVLKKEGFSRINNKEKQKEYKFNNHWNVNYYELDI